MIALDLLVVSTSLPQIRADFGASVVELQWAVTGYGLAFGALLLTGAALGERYGRKAVLVAGLTLFVCSSAACALSGSVALLVAARVAQGAGAALVIPVAIAMVSAEFPGERRGRAIGVVEGVTGLAVVGGPVVGGALASGPGWEWIFWLNVPIGLGLMAVTCVQLVESRKMASSLDLVGLLLVTGGVLSVIWGLVRGNEQGWTSTGTLLVLACGVGLLTGFVAWELRIRSPMLPMRLFRVRTFSAAVAISFLLFAGLYGFVFFTAQFLQASLGYSALQAGLALIPSGAALLVVAPLAARWADRVGQRLPLLAGLGLQTLGFTWLALVARPDAGYAELIGPFIVAGIGTSTAIPVVQTTLLGAVDTADLGIASGVNNMVQELGGGVGVAVLVTVFSTVGGVTSAQDFSDGYAAALGAAAALSVLGVVAALTIRRDRTHQTS